MLGPDDPMTVFLWPLHPVHIPGLESDSGYLQHSSLCPDLGGLIDLLAQSGCSARDANTLGMLPDSCLQNTVKYVVWVHQDARPLQDQEVVVDCQFYQFLVPVYELNIIHR